MREYDRKLPPEDAIDMRELYATGDYTMNELAEMYNVAQTTAWKIIQGFSYKAVTGGEPVALPNGRKRANAKWNKENIRIIACNVRKEKKEAFQAACRRAGTTPNAVLLAAVDKFLEEHKDSAE